MLYVCTVSEPNGRHTTLLASGSDAAEALAHLDRDFPEVTFLMDVGAVDFTLRPVPGIENAALN